MKGGGDDELVEVGPFALVFVCAVLPWSAEELLLEGEHQVAPLVGAEAVPPIVSLGGGFVHVAHDDDVGLRSGLYDAVGQVHQGAMGGVARRFALLGSAVLAGQMADDEVERVAID